MDSFLSLYLLNKLHNAAVTIKDPEKDRFLGTCHASMSVRGESEKIWLVPRLDAFESFTIQCLPGVNNEILVNFVTYHSELLAGENGTLRTLANTAENTEIPNSQWKLISTSKESKRTGDKVWFNFHIQHVASNQYLHAPPDSLFPNSQLSLSNEPFTWAIGVTRITMIVIGCGQRGGTYARFAAENPSKVRLIGAVDPRPHRLDLLRANQKLKGQFDDRLLFDDWKQLLDFHERVADAVVIATPDRTHAEIAIHCARLKYHILLEKPMATTAEDCKNIVKEIKENECVLAVCHVLRYTPYSRAIKDLVSSGALGEIINIQHLEPVGFYHFAHSYVRGNWRNEKESSFSLLAKSCHDIDWIRWIMNKKCSKISSLGSLKHFKKENKPEGAASRCLDCKVSSECPYSAKTIYLDLVKMGYTHWPVEVIVNGPVTLDSVTEALKEGPYGRCVYESDNDVVDNQVVNIQFEDGSTASFSMIAFTKELCVRKTRIFGSMGELECDGHSIKHFNFITQQTTTVIPNHNLSLNTSLTGHDYGDYFIIKDFVDAVTHNKQSLIVSGPDETLESHLMVFKAEQSRHESNVQDIEW